MYELTLNKLPGSAARKVNVDPSSTWRSFITANGLTDYDITADGSLIGPAEYDNRIGGGIQAVIAAKSVKGA